MAELSNASILSRRQSAWRKRGQTVTYRQRSDSVSRTTGTVTASNTDTSLSDPGVLVGQVTQQQIDDSGGKFNIGTKVFKILSADLPEDPPKTTSQLIWNSNTYNIVHHRAAGDTNVVEVFANKV